MIHIGYESEVINFTACDTISNMFKQILKLPFWVVMLGIAAVLIVIALLFSSLNPWNPLNYFARPATTVDISRTAVIRDIQSLNRLETTSYTIDKIIEAGSDGNIFQEILFGDKILLIASGQVRAGVDLSQIEEKDVQITEKILTITLPNTKIFSTQLIAEQTKVYDRQMGLLSRGDKDLETVTRQAAEQSIQQAACEAGILNQAVVDAREQLTQMYTLAGFSQVNVQVQAGKCS